MFSQFPRLWQRVDEDIIGHWSKLDRQQADCPALASEVQPASFAVWLQIRNSIGLKCVFKTHMTTRVPRLNPSKHPILYRPWRCRPDSAYNQSSCESSSHIDGSELPSCVQIFLSVQTKWLSAKHIYFRSFLHVLAAPKFFNFSGMHRGHHSIYCKFMLEPSVYIILHVWFLRKRNDCEYVELLWTWGMFAKLMWNCEIPLNMRIVM